MRVYSIDETKQSNLGMFKKESKTMEEVTGRSGRIDRCRDCVFFNLIAIEFVYEPHCEYDYADIRPIPDPDSIPKWCKLKNYRRR